MPKVWSLVQNVTKDWTSFQNMTKKVSKRFPKFGHFFQNEPKKLPKVRSLCGNISTWPISNMSVFWHNSECLLTSYRGAACKVALNTSFCSTQASCSPTTFTAKHILLSMASPTCSKQVARHSHSSRDIEAFNMISNSRSVTKFLGDKIMC